MKSIRCLWLLPFFLLLGACTSVPKVQTQYSPSASFSGAKTFAVLPMPTQITGANPGAMVTLAGPAKAAIISDMKAKGYTEVPQESAALWVNLHGELLPRTKVINTGASYGMDYGDPWLNSYPYASQQIVREYEQGTLAIEISENKGGQGDLVWVGWTTNKRAPGADINVDKVVANIHEILADFPPDKK